MRTILLIEDNDNNVSLLEDVFAYDGIEANLKVVGSGEEAMACAAAIQPALVLMDLRLPGIDGLETTGFLKRDPRTKDIPVWAITAYAMRGDEEYARAAGCDEYITKPTENTKLADKLHTFLTQLDRQETASCPNPKC